MMKKLLEHPRYNNEYYHKRKYKFQEKEESHMQNFTKYIGTKRVDEYIEWFLKNKENIFRSAEFPPGLSSALDVK